MRWATGLQKRHNQMASNDRTDIQVISRQVGEAGEDASSIAFEGIRLPPRSASGDSSPEEEDR